MPSARSSSWHDKMRLLFDAHPLACRSAHRTPRHPVKKHRDKARFPPLRSLHHTLHLHLHSSPDTSSIRCPVTRRVPDRNWGRRADWIDPVTRPLDTFRALSRKKPFGSVVSHPLASASPRRPPLTSPSCVPTAHGRNGAVPIPHLQHRPELTSSSVTNSCHPISLHLHLSPLCAL